MRVLCALIALCVIFNFATPICTAQDFDSLQALIQEALASNPEVQTAYNRWKAAEHKAGYAGGLPDPQLRYTYQFENVETRVGPQEQKFGVSQKIPYPAKLSKKTRAQKRLAQEEEARYEATKREVIKKVKFLYYDLYWIDRAIEITEQEKDVVSAMEKVAKKKYETTRASGQDIIKIQLELSRLLNRLLQLKQSRIALQAKLNSVLARPSQMSITTLRRIPLPKFEYALDQLHAFARMHRQELRAAKLAIEKAELERSLASLEFVPDVTLGFDYIKVGSGTTTRVDDGEDAYMGTIAVNVPLWFGQVSAKINEKKKLLEAQRSAARDIEETVRYEVEDIYSKIITYRDTLSLYTSALIPQAKQAVTTTQTGYEAGRGNFIDWLDAQRILLKTRLAYHRTIADYMKSIAFLERIVGEDLKEEDA